MNRIALASGLATVLVLAGAYFGLPYAGVHLDQTLLVVAAAILAVGYSIAGFSALVLNRPVAARAYGATRMNETPVWEFVSPFKEPDAIHILARPGIPAEIALIRYQRVFDNPSEHAGRKVILTIKKGRRGADELNPVVLQKLFDKLKPFSNSHHVLLVNEHDEFAGYIPWGSAIKEFTGANAETKIRKCIVDVLARPDDAKSVDEIRAIGGIAAGDIISDTATIHEAAQMTWDYRPPMGGLPHSKLASEKPLNGLVVYSGKRNRKPIGVISRSEILQLVATGA